MARMRIAVTGASGLIGSALTASLAADGHEVVALVRRGPHGPGEVRWDPSAGTVDPDGLAGCEAVVHLAGAPVAERRWSDKRKKVLLDSRVDGTATIAKAMAALDPKPRVLVAGSAIGFYGDTGDRFVDEDSPAGEGFLADLVQAWEAAADPARAAGIRTVHARTGLVVSPQGGAWGALFPFFRAGLGGRLGSGRQYWSFISLRDEVAALRYAIDNEELSGPVNLTGPEPRTNSEVTKAMGRVLHRPTVLPVPSFALRAVLGEFAGDVTGSQRVRPKRLLDAGFSFAHPDLDDAIKAALPPRNRV
ncbi:TIGR01777 family oxidoreductase [Streptomyces sp. NBC_00669]|uniref:TIGR01777 family oxidoreductase n=1 Tax=unclassified Streptomyces TaxID=2593676 RepID=UPI002E3789A8|nr:TIGR01777 family oxidoreductase [Streptomyces sp. NBC_00669]